MATVGPRWQWGVRPEDQPNKRPRTAKFLNEMLLDFPDPKSLHRHTDSSASSKQEDTVACLNQRHREQRRRLLDRHTKEYTEWSAENERWLDGESFRHRYSYTLINSGIPKPSFELISSAEAKEALKRLPANKRATLVCSDQLLPPPPGTLPEKDKENLKGLTSVEFAALMAEQGVEVRQQMCDEEQELRIFQEDSKELFWEAMVRTNPEKYRKRSIPSASAPDQQHHHRRAEEMRHKPRPPPPSGPRHGLGGNPQQDSAAAPSRDPRLNPQRRPSEQSLPPTPGLTFGGNFNIDALTRDMTRDTKPPPDPRARDPRLLPQKSPKRPGT